MWNHRIWTLDSATKEKFRRVKREEKRIEATGSLVNVMDLRGEGDQ